MSNRMTIKEFAAIAGVSTSTVSKAWNDRNDISVETKKRLKVMAKDLGYSPNIMAVGLKQRKTGLIGVILPNIRDEFFIKFLKGVEKAARKRGYNVIFSVSEEKFLKEKEILSGFSNGSVDGVLISLSKQSQRKNLTYHLAQALKNHFPMVQYDRVSEHIEGEKVVIDDRKAAFKATNTLIGLGAKSILYISNMGNTSVGRLRQIGFLEALDNSNIKIGNVVLDVDTKSDISLLLNEYLNSLLPLAILASDAHTAIRVQKTVLSLGYRIPKDVSIIGFTDGDLAKLATPGMSVISQNAEFMGKKAVDRLMYRIISRKRNHAFATSVIDTELVLRGSIQSYVE